MTLKVIVSVLTTESATSLFTEHALGYRALRPEAEERRILGNRGREFVEDLHVLSFITFDQGIQLVSSLIQVRTFDSTLWDRQHQDLGSRLEWDRGDGFDFIVKLVCRDTIGDIIRST